MQWVSLTVTDADNNLRTALLPGLGAGLMLGALLLILIAALLPHRPAWMPEDPALEAHATALTVDAEGRLIMGTRDGQLWRHDGTWQALDPIPGERAATRLAVVDGQLLIAAPDGLFDRTGRVGEIEGRIVDVRTFDDDRTLLGGAPGVLARDGQDNWQDTGLRQRLGDETQIYRIWQTRNGDLHAGTIGDGVWSLAADATDWSSNNRELPEDSKVFALAEADNGVLLAGTDQGLFWQAAGSDHWRAMDGGDAADRRILDLLIDPAADGDHPVLLAASDDGVLRVELVLRDDWVETRGRWQMLDTGPHGLDGSVSHLAISKHGLWAAAGTVYHYQPVAPAIRLPMVMLAGILLGLGVFLLTLLRWRL